MVWKPAPWLALPGYEAFLITPRSGGPCYLIQWCRVALARELARGRSLQAIVTLES